MARDAYLTGEDDVLPDVGGAGKTDLRTKQSVGVDGAWVSGQFDVEAASTASGDKLPEPSSARTPTE